MSVSPFQLIVLVLVALFFLAVGVGSTYLMMRMRELNARIQALETSLSARAAGTGDGDLKSPRLGAKRMPYEAAEEVIDAVAVLDAMREKRMLEVEHYDNVKAHLVKALESGTKRASAPVRDEGAL